MKDTWAKLRCIRVLGRPTGGAQNPSSFKDTSDAHHTVRHAAQRRPARPRLGGAAQPAAGVHSRAVRTERKVMSSLNGQSQLLGSPPPLPPHLGPRCRSLSHLTAATNVHPASCTQASPCALNSPCRSAICLVCHRWRQLLLGEPAAWCSLRIRGGPPAPELRKQWAAATRALLQRHGGGLRSLFVSGCAALEAGGQPPAGPAVGAGPQVAAVQQPVPTSLSDLLAPLPPGRLTRLSLEWGPLLPPDALQPLSHLTCLECLVS